MFFETIVEFAYFLRLSRIVESPQVVAIFILLAYPEKDAVSSSDFEESGPSKIKVHYCLEAANSF